MNTNHKLTHVDIKKQLEDISNLKVGEQSVDYYGRVFTLKDPREDYTYSLPGCGFVSKYVVSLWYKAKFLLGIKATAQINKEIPLSDRIICIKNAKFLIDEKLDYIAGAEGNNIELIEKVVKTFNKLVRTTLEIQDQWFYSLDSRTSMGNNNQYIENNTDAPNIVENITNDSEGGDVGGYEPLEEVNTNVAITVENNTNIAIRRKRRKINPRDLGPVINENRERHPDNFYNVTRLGNQLCTHRNPNCICSNK